MAPAYLLCGGGFRKGTMASACLEARHFSFSLDATGSFQAAISVLELRGSESEQVSPCVGSLRGTAWGSRSFFHRLSPHWFLQSEVVETYLPDTGTVGLWGLVWDWDSWLLNIPPEFLSTTRGCGTTPFDICAPPTILYGCGFFNSVVVRLPFSPTPDSSE